MHGVILIDKPKGPSSFAVINKIRKLTALKRVGHAGTLDPQASGLLVVALGTYTKLCGYLTQSSKVYEVKIHLGIKTTTDDSEGNIIAEQAIGHLDLLTIEDACLKFTGSLQQIPPKFSALKINGQRAYKLARANQDFLVAARPVEIFSLQFIAFDAPFITIRVHCSKGTYMRALARDIGDYLGVGAYACDIRRIASGDFSLNQAVKLDELQADILEKYVLQGTSALGGLEQVNINSLDYEHIRHGRKITLEYKLNNPVGIALYQNKAVAIVEARGHNAMNILRII